MNSSIVKNGSQPILHISLKKGESVWAETGSLMFMSPRIKIVPQIEKQLPAKSRGDAIALEKLRKAKFKSLEDDTEISFAPPSPGEILKIDLNNEKIVIDGLGFLASSDGLEFKTIGSLKSMLTDESLFLQTIERTGTAYLKCYGDIYERELLADESLIVDAVHFIAHHDSVTYKMQKPKDNKLAKNDGEWMICKYTGPGKLWMQTRNRSELAKEIQRYFA